MARVYGRHYPERHEMAAISDMLDIPHFTTAHGSTVRKDFLLAVGRRLGLDVSESTRKDDVLRMVWEAAQGRPMPDDRYSPGTTVTNRVLREIRDGLVHNGRPGRGPLPAPPARMLLPEDVGAEDEPEFDPSTLADERTKRLQEVADREASDRWRNMVLDAYGSRCAITGSDEVRVLDAAHIAPYRGPKFNVLANGLCLRTDIHRLFDRGTLAIHETTHEVLLHPVVQEASYGELLRDATFTPPRLRRDRPSKAVLRAHRLWCGLGD